jgi:hypothetical protein
MDNQLFYIVQPTQLEFLVTGVSLQRRRDRLGELVRVHGAEWTRLRMRGPDFLAAVERIDRYLGAGEELMDSAFENSPKQLLPIGSSGEYNPMFGYYEPYRVREFDKRLRTITASAFQGWEAGPNGDIMGQVVYAFRSTFTEAAKRGWAIAIEHS